METIINFIYLTLTIVMMVATYTAARNFAKSPVRVYLLDIICGVIMGCLAGYRRNDISSGLILGIFIGLLFVLGGAVSRWQIGLFTELQQKRTKENEE
jgi:hypothetical protein